MRDSEVFDLCMRHYRSLGLALQSQTSEWMMLYRSDIAIAALEAVGERIRRGRLRRFLEAVYLGGEKKLNFSEWQIESYDREVRKLCGKRFRELRLFPLWRYRIGLRRRN